MNKKFLLVAVLTSIFIGCGQQPNIEIDSADDNAVEQNQTQTQPQEQNNTEQHVVEVTQPQEQNLTPPQEIVTQEDIIDTGIVETEENISQNSYEPQKYNQNLAADISAEIVYFDFDKFNIKDTELSKVQRVANLLKDYNKTYTLRIEGNCDEWGSDEYNYALGLKRAKSVKNMLENLGIDSNKLTIISYGESNPVCLAHNKQCWAQNRRDNFTLLP